MNRRFFLKSGGIALASIGMMSSAPSFIRRAVMAQARIYPSNGRRKTLIAIFQRGAVDGLNMVVPYGESNYYNLRSTIAIQRPKGVMTAGTQAETAIDLDGFFGLHPALSPLKKFWDERTLAIVHAAGSPDATRSHFDAQDFMESGTPGLKGTTDGWLNRYLQAQRVAQASPFRAVSMTQNLPRSLQGRAEALAISNLNDFAIRAGASSARLQGGFEDIYEQSAGDALRGTGKETFEAINFLRRVNPQQYKPENGAVYPNTKFGQSLLQIAQLIKAGVGLEIAFTDIGGWDTHVNQGNARGQLAGRLQEFGAGLAALATDLGPQRMQDVVVITMSEFGRTVRENGNRGTDHGHANAMFILGGTARGGKVYGDWPGLSNDKLYEGRDLALTTDFRDVFSEVITKHLGQVDVRTVFPNYNGSAAKYRGVLS
jgi:uncharacterized protein (DUF1501 family)